MSGLGRRGRLVLVHHECRSGVGEGHAAPWHIGVETADKLSGSRSITDLTTSMQDETGMLRQTEPLRHGDPADWDSHSPGRGVDEMLCRVVLWANLDDGGRGTE